MINRRQLLGSGAALLSFGGLNQRAAAQGVGGSKLPVPPSRQLAFAVFRNGARIGTQRLRFVETGDKLRIENVVHLQVKILDVVAFNYQATIIEHWTHGMFASAQSDINSNGTLHRVVVERHATGVAISGNKIKSYNAPANALPLTYWNKAGLHAPMINMQTGHTDHPTITDLGWFALPELPSGTIRARAYKLSGALHLTIYYDQQNRWQGLAFDHSGHITYEPIAG